MQPFTYLLLPAYLSSRNRIRRLIRESFRLLQHDLPRGYDFVVTLRPHEPLAQAEPVEAAPFEQARAFHPTLDVLVNNAAVQVAKGYDGVALEASGGLTLDRAADVAATGVDVAAKIIAFIETNCRHGKTRTRGKG